MAHSEGKPPRESGHHRSRVLRGGGPGSCSRSTASGSGTQCCGQERPWATYLLHSLPPTRLALPARFRSSSPAPAGPAGMSSPSGAPFPPGSLGLTPPKGLWRKLTPALAPVAEGLPALGWWGLEVNQAPPGTFQRHQDSCRCSRIAWVCATISAVSSASRTSP